MNYQLVRNNNNINLLSIYRETSVSFAKMSSQPLCDNKMTFTLWCPNENFRHLR